MSVLTILSILLGIVLGILCGVAIGLVAIKCIIKLWPE